MGQDATDIPGKGLGQGEAAERELEALRAQLTQRDNAVKQAQVRLQQEIAHRDQIIAEGELTQPKLRESETAWRQLFDQNLDSMMIIDLETGRYIDVNEEYTRQSGYHRESIVRKRSHEIPSFAIPEQHERLVTQPSRAGLVRNIEE